MFAAALAAALTLPAAAVPAEGISIARGQSGATMASVSAGGAHTCAVKTDGRLACWGADGDSRVSGPNASTDTFSAVSAGDGHTCALKTAGDLDCWGNDDGSGRVSGPNASAATFSALSSGSTHTCALKTAGDLDCWGDDNAGTVAGPNASTDSFVVLSAGFFHTCAVKVAGDLDCWGINGFGQVSGPNASSDTFSSVSAGRFHTCAVKTDGDLVCWGNDGGSGRVSGPNASTDTFTAVGLGDGFDGHTCALKTNGRLACWGLDGSGEVSGPNGSTDTFSALSAGYDDSCAVKTDGRLACWGANGSGQLGSAPQTPAPAPASPATTGSAYGHTFTSETGSPSGSFSVTAGSLPPGLSLSGAGVISGTPSSTGTFNFTVAASNGLFPDASAPFSIVVQGPTAATVVSFSARRAPGAVIVRWRTAQETGLAGFNLYRGGVKLNWSLIASTLCGRVSGHHYSFLDRKAPRAGLLRYRLAAIGLDGRRVWQRKLIAHLIS